MINLLSADETAGWLGDSLWRQLLQIYHITDACIF